MQALVGHSRYALLSIYDGASRWVVRQPYQFFVGVLIVSVLQLLAIVWLLSMQSFISAQHDIPKQYPLRIELQGKDDALMHWLGSLDGVESVSVRGSEEASAWLSSQYGWNDLEDIVQWDQLPVQYHISFNQQMSLSQLPKLLTQINSYQPINTQIDKTGWQTQVKMKQSQLRLLWALGIVGEILISACLWVLMVMALKQSGDLLVWRQLGIRQNIRRWVLRFYTGGIWLLSALVSWLVVCAWFYGLAGGDVGDIGRSFLLWFCVFHGVQVVVLGALSRFINVQ
ncbi:MAG: hypothetical protein ACON5A_00930 [Candidatus Comchoanobacterales bacterium]